MTTKKTAPPKVTGLNGGGFLKLFDENLKITHSNKTELTFSFMGVSLGKHTGKVIK